MSDNNLTVLCLETGPMPFRALRLAEEKNIFAPPAEQIGLFFMENSQYEIARSSMKRILTVGRGYYDYRLRSGSAPRPVPMLQLKGYWLETAGLATGTKVELTVSTTSVVVVAENPKQKHE